MSEKQTQYITIILTVIIIIATGVVIYTNLPEETNNEKVEQSETLDIPFLKVIYNGKEKEYTLQQLTELDTMTGYGGYRTSYPSIKGQDTYTGVLVTSLVEDIAGPISNYSIKAVANDEGKIENQTYNYTTINGNVDIYNANNASEILDTGGVNMILCYQADGKPLNSSENGNIKIAFINQDEEKITPAFLWWKFVESIEIIP